MAWGTGLFHSRLRKGIGHRWTRAAQAATETQGRDFDAETRRTQRKRGEKPIHRRGAEGPREADNEHIWGGRQVFLADLRAQREGWRAGNIDLFENL
jgi:hypothetical protein